MSLLGPNGQPISSKSFARPRKDQPLIGELSPAWAGRTDDRFSAAPPPLSIAFDTSMLTLADYRMMRDHYQVNSSLNILTFMLHQADWRLEGGSAKSRAHCEENLRAVWTRLARALSQAFWAGFSPIGVQWENDLRTNKVVVTKLKDLLPEECVVNWKEVKAVSEDQRDHHVKPKAKIFDGIKQVKYATLKPRNSLWYPLLMDNGDYYGRKLLKSAFQPWYFSMLMHLFSNRYFERFGEPTPIARAPYDDVIDVNGEQYQGNVLAANMLRLHRSGGAVVLPNNRTPDKGMSAGGESTYDYTLEYLESQMRGADFERYLIRLDQEISLALFTPLTMLQAPSSGSFNLGVSHVQTYLWMLNSILADWAEYINRYLLAQMNTFNFRDEPEAPRIVFRKLGASNDETVRAVLTALVGAGRVKPNITELGQMAGMELEEIEQIVEPQDGAPDGGSGKIDPNKKPDGKQKDTRVGRPDKRDAPKGTDKVKTVASKMADRVAGQLESSRKTGKPFEPDLGHRAQFSEALNDEHWVRDPHDVYSQCATLVAVLGQESAPGADFRAEAADAIERVALAAAGDRG